jgi:hypothetical protein
MHSTGELNLAGIGFCIAMTSFVALAIWASPRIQRWAEKPQPPQSNAIDSSNYKPPYHALHVIDFERSTIYVQWDGSVIARCAVQGCSVTTVIGRNVAQAVVIEGP